MPSKHLRLVLKKYDDKLLKKHYKIKTRIRKKRKNLIMKQIAFRNKKTSYVRINRRTTGFWSTFSRSRQVCVVAMVMK